MPLRLFGFRNPMQNFGVQVLLVVFVGVTLLAALLSYVNYRNTLSDYNQAVKEKLLAVAQTTALSIDPADHRYLTRRYREKNSIGRNNQDSIYQHYNRLLSRIQRQNNLPTPVLTLIRHPRKDSAFQYILTGNPQPYFRHSWKRSIPQVMLDSFEHGGAVGPYTAYVPKEHEWITGFAPIKDSSGRTLALVEADMRFDHYQKEARTKLLNNFLVGLPLALLIMVLLYLLLRAIIRKEEDYRNRLDAKNQEIRSQMEEISQQSDYIEQQNRHLHRSNQKMADSLEYASKIQRTILPKTLEIHQGFPEFFVFYQPRDVVSGDLYWFAQVYDRSYLACIDCTGHGVPGAMMSVIAYTELNKVIRTDGLSKPCEILVALNESVQEAMRQKKSSPDFKGMDIGMVVFDQQEQQLGFAGAKINLQVAKNGAIESYRAARHSIGGHIEDMHQVFKTTWLAPDPEATYYFSTDGFPDQFGGPHFKKYMTGNLKKLLARLHAKPLPEQKALLGQELMEWKGANEQTDDVLVMGFRLK